MRSGCSGAAAPCPSDAAVVYTASAAYGLSYDALRCPHSRRLPSSCPHSCRRIPRRTCVPAIRGALRLAHQPLPSRVLRCVRFVVQHAPLSVFTAAAVIDFSSVLPETSSAVRSSCSGCRCALPTSRSRREFCFACVWFVVRCALLSAFAVSPSSPLCRRKPRGHAFRLFGVLLHLVHRMLPSCVLLYVRAVRRAACLCYLHPRHLPSSCPHPCRRIPRQPCVPAVRVPLRFVRRSLPSCVPLCVRAVCRAARSVVRIRGSCPRQLLSVPPETSPAVCSGCLGCRCALPTSRSRRVFCFTCVRFVVRRALVPAFTAPALVVSSPCRRRPRRPCVPAVRGAAGPCAPSASVACSALRAMRSVACPLRAAGDLASRVFQLFGMCRCALSAGHFRHVFCFTCVRFVVRRALLPAFAAAALVISPSVPLDSSPVMRSGCSGAVALCASADSVSCSALRAYGSLCSTLRYLHSRQLPSHPPCCRIPRQPCIPAVRGAAAPCASADSVACSALRACGSSCGTLRYPRSRRLPPFPYRRIPRQPCVRIRPLTLCAARTGIRRCECFGFGGCGCRGRRCTAVRRF